MEGGAGSAAMLARRFHAWVMEDNPLWPDYVPLWRKLLCALLVPLVLASMALSAFAYGVASLTYWLTVKADGRPERLPFDERIESE